MIASPSGSVALNSPTIVPTGWFSVIARAAVEFRSVGAELLTSLKILNVRVPPLSPYALSVNKKLINVFVPTTPNPTSGFLLMFPIDEVIYLNMSFEEASKFIVSAGTSNIKS